MSGVLRRGSLSFILNDREAKKRGSIESNLYGGYRDAHPRTPEISVIAIDFRRYSEDLKKDKLPPLPSLDIEETQSNGISLANKQENRDLSQDVDSDEISNFMGHYGLWQFVWTFLLCLLQIPTTFHMFAFVFQSAEKDFWCARPQQFPDIDVDLWRNLTQLNGGSFCSALDLDYSLFPSMAELIDYLQLTAANNISHNLLPCTQYEFFSSSSGSAKTLTEEFGLVCNRKNMLSVVEMCFLAGAAVGSVSSGWISDRFGRKHTLMGFATVQALFGTALAFVPTLSLYMTLRVIVGFASMTVAVVSFVLVVELVSGRWRTIIGILNILPVAVTYVLTAGLAYLIRDWRTLQFTISLPWLLLLSCWYWLPESPRWLLATGRLTELYSIIERAARTNGRVLPPNYRKTLEAVAPAAPQQQQPTAAQQAPASLEEGNNTIREQSLSTSAKLPCSSIDANVSPLVMVFSKDYWKTTLLTLIVWLTLIIIYFGLTLHLSNLGGDIYVNTAIAGTAEAVSICLSVFVVLKVGIRKSLIAYMLIPGICCLATNFVPADESSMTVIALAMIAKCVIGANNAIIPTYTAMQYPTVVRNFGVGMGNLAAGVALILVPYMWLLEHIEPLLPMSIMGICGLVGALGLICMKDIEQ